ncbi:MAG: hypothetical protein ABMA25_20605, partial [Ilumatobacteraceae bacterium]
GRRARTGRRGRPTYARRVARVQVRLRSVLPRWILATDPYVRVNDGEPRRLTQAPVEFEVPAGQVHVEVTLFAPGTDDSWGGGPAEYTEQVDADDVLRLSFHPSWLSSSMRRGHLRPE